jgi:hypothetical protein
VKNVVKGAVVGATTGAVTGAAEAGRKETGMDQPDQNSGGENSEKTPESNNY